MEWLGLTPVDDAEVAHGSYAVVLESDGYADMRVPVLARRGENVRVDVRMYPEDEIPDDFVIIPGGPFLTGRVDSAHAVEVMELGDFDIMRHPVTCGEYLEFLNDIAEDDLERALHHAPRIDADGESYFPVDSSGTFRLPDSHPEGDKWQAEWPILMVNFEDAVAYADWRSDKEQRPYRLPTAEEWEKAGRGVDGRIYPWGDNFDPAFCRVRTSRPGRPIPAPVESFSIDCSPYGVMDMAGNIAEWTDSPGRGGDTRLLQGASYNSIELMCRLDFSMSSPTNSRLPHYGFRLALTLDGGDNRDARTCVKGMFEHSTAKES